MLLGPGKAAEVRRNWSACPTPEGQPESQRSRRHRHLKRLVEYRISSWGQLKGSVLRQKFHLVFGTTMSWPEACEDVASDLGLGGGFHQEH